MDTEREAADFFEQYGPELSRQVACELLKLAQDETSKHIKKLKSLQTDEERWRYVINNNPEDLIILLDNDQTCITFKDSDAGIYFDYPIGWDDGVIVLLDAIGVKAEQV